MLYSVINLTTPPSLMDSASVKLRNIAISIKVERERWEDRGREGGRERERERWGDGGKERGREGGRDR